MHQRSSSGGDTGGNASFKYSSTADIFLHMNLCEGVSSGEINCAYGTSNSSSGPSAAKCPIAPSPKGTSSRQPFYVLSSSDGPWLTRLPGATKGRHRAAASASGVGGPVPGRLAGGPKPSRRASLNSCPLLGLNPCGESLPGFQDSWAFPPAAASATNITWTDIPTAATVGNCPHLDLQFDIGPRRGSCSTSQDFHLQVMGEQKRQMGQLIHQQSPKQQAKR